VFGGLRSGAKTAEWRRETDDACRGKKWEIKKVHQLHKDSIRTSGGGPATSDLSEHVACKVYGYKAF